MFIKLYAKSQIPDHQVLYVCHSMETCLDVLGRVHTTRSASTMSAKERKARK